MKPLPTPSPAPAGKIRPGIKVALVIVTSSVWLSTLSYARSPVEKQPSITFSVFLLLGFLLVLGVLPRFSAFVRSLVFTGKDWNQDMNQKSLGIALYALTLLVCHFVWR